MNMFHSYLKKLYLLKKKMGTYYFMRYLNFKSY